MGSRYFHHLLTITEIKMPEALKNQASGIFAIGVTGFELYHNSES